MLSIPKMNYDSTHDVFRYILVEGAESYGDDEDNLTTFRDFQTDEVTGYCIMDFLKICTERGKAYLKIAKIIDIEAAMKFCGKC